MGKQPTPALSAEQIHELADAIELDPQQVSKDKLSTLRSQLLGSLNVLKQLLGKEQTAGKWMRLRALFFLLVEHPKHLAKYPKRSYKQILKRAAEWTLLRIAQDPRYPEKTRQRMSPAPIFAGSGLVYALHGASPRELARCTQVEDIEQLKLKRSSVYKPKEQAAGGIDCPVRFAAVPRDWGPYYEKWVAQHGEDTDPDFPRRLELVQHKEGWAFHALEATGPAKQAITPERYSVENIPHKLQLGGLTYRGIERARNNILPGEGVLAEALYYRLCSYLEDQAAKLGDFPLKDFGCPITSIEAMQHPSFGRHHGLGSRQDYVNNGLSALLWARQVAAASAAGTNPLEKLSYDQFLKFVIPDLISGNLDRNFSNMLITDDVIHPIDAGSSFPHFIGEEGVLAELIQQDWAPLEQFSKPLPKHWVQLIDSLDAQDLVARLREESTWLSKRFPKAQLRLASSQEIVVHAAISFLKAFAKKAAWSARKLTTYYRPVPLREMNGDYAFTDDKQIVHTGAEFWFTIDVVCFKEKFNYLDNSEIPPQVTERLRKAYTRLLKREEILRNNSPYMVEERRRYSPALFVRWVLEGRYDEHFPKRPKAKKAPRT